MDKDGSIVDILRQRGVKKEHLEQNNIIAEHIRNINEGSDAYNDDSSVRIYVDDARKLMDIVNVSQGVQLQQEMVDAIKNGDIEKIMQQLEELSHKNTEIA